MYIHLGGEKVIQASELIAILDLSIETSSKISKQFTIWSKENKRTEDIGGEEEHKSLVVTNHAVYYSPISSQTLKKRVSKLRNI